jgi:hypothetical protein
MNQLQTISSNLPALLEKVEQAEKEMLKYEQVECPVRHIFGPGLYIREVTLPANTWAIGHHQNLAQMNIMIKGKVRMYNHDGSTSVLEAPQTFMGCEGRKAGYVIEETLWQNVYATTETNVEKLELTYLTKSAVSLEYQQQRFLEQDQHLEDRADYAALIQEMGMTEEQVRQQVEDLSDHVEMPLGSYKFQLGDSPIHGKGTFATSLIRSGEVIGPALLNDKRTVLGRLGNHSISPNAQIVQDGKDLWLVAIRDIAGKCGPNLGEEILTNYRATILLKKELQCLDHEK